MNNPEDEPLPGNAGAEAVVGWIGQPLKSKKNPGAPKYWSGPQTLGMLAIF
jgi:hypothetical protein